MMAPTVRMSDSTCWPPARSPADTFSPKLANPTFLLGGGGFPINWFAEAAEPLTKDLISSRCRAKNSSNGLELVAISCYF